MDGVLNEFTCTVHRRADDYSECRSVCGATLHVQSDHLEVTAIERALDDVAVSRCGRCFVGGGGY